MKKISNVIKYYINNLINILITLLLKIKHFRNLKVFRNIKIFIKITTLKTQKLIKKLRQLRRRHKLKLLCK